MSHECKRAIIFSGGPAPAPLIATTGYIINVPQILVDPVRLTQNIPLRGCTTVKKQLVTV